MSKWNLIIDITRCNNCNNCVIAAKDEHVGNDFPGYAAPQPTLGHRWIETRRAEHGSAPILDLVHIPTMCNHCDEAPCVKAGNGAVKKRDDGIVIIDPVLARGRRDLVGTCPYGAIWWNEELQLPQHWIFDAHLLDKGWIEPRCAQVCPTQAIRAVKVEDTKMQELVADQGLEVLAPELGCRPRVYYRNLHRYSRWMLAGSVSAHRSGCDECIEGVLVRLSSGDQMIAETATDPFGEFRIFRLPPKAAEYTLEITHAGFVSVRRSVNLQASLTLPHMTLVPN